MRAHPAVNLAALYLGCLAATPFACGQIPEFQDRVVHYNDSRDLADPVALLQQRLLNGTAKLEYEPEHGYLKALLAALQVPIASQGLVFSKTTEPSNLVRPKTPRAVYFNDRTYVSWIPGGDFIDITAEDPKKGPIFYTLDQRAPKEPRFARDRQCFRCHLGPKTLNVPGPMLRSVVTQPDGRAISEIDRFTIGHASPFEFRWGGWYVTPGEVGFAHKGNVAGADKLAQPDTAHYLAPGSDAAALMIQAHQIKLQNLITRANWETRQALAQQKAGDPAASSLTRQRIAQYGEPLLAYILFRDEAAMPAPVSGDPSFVNAFERVGPRDAKGRSLRELDLKTRLMRYPCSYLIYSPAIDAFPAELRTYFWQRMYEVLSGQDHSPRFATLTVTDRQAVFEILRDTRPEFAALIHN